MLWERTVASQMKAESYESTQIVLNSNKCIFHLIYRYNYLNLKLFEYFRNFQLSVEKLLFFPKSIYIVYIDFAYHPVKPPVSFLIHLPVQTPSWTAFLSQFCLPAQQSIS